MKKSIITILLIGFSILASAHSGQFLGCVDNKLKWKFHAGSGHSGKKFKVTPINKQGNPVGATQEFPIVNQYSTFSLEQIPNQNYYWFKISCTGNDYNATFKLNENEICKISLPIKVNDFKARRTENLVELQWKTSNEKGFSHFEIQGMNDSKEIFSLGTTIQRYFSVETDLPYVRLKNIDLDGSFDFTSWVAVIKREKELTLIEKRANGNLYWDGFKKVFVTND
mgnify:CR=1 FL=1